MGADLSPLFTIAGISAATWLTEVIMERTGHGDKTVFLRIIGHGTAAVYCFTTWWGYIHRVARMFGVFI